MEELVNKGYGDQKVPRGWLLSRALDHIGYKISYETKFANHTSSFGPEFVSFCKAH